MILYAYTANPNLLPKNVWLQKAPLYAGDNPEWTAGVTTYGDVRWSKPTEQQGSESFEHSAVQCQCALLPPGVATKYVEDGEMWIDLDNHYAVDIYGPSTAANLRLFLAEHGIKVTLNRLLTILSMDAKDTLKYIEKWNKIAEAYHAKQYVAKNATDTTLATDELVNWLTQTIDTPKTVPKINTLYDELMAGKIKVKPKISPYKWVLAKGVIVRPEAEKASDEPPSEVAF